jgi:hypothetical protein
VRALSIKQPWAELIARGKKKIEYRTWARSFRGDLLVVASKTRNDDDCRAERIDPGSVPYGVAVCVVDFWKVTGDEGDYEWHVRRPRRVEPFPVKGYASIYNVEDARIRILEPDVDRLRAISEEMYALIDAGRWTRREYHRLLQEGSVAVNGDDEMLEFIVNEGIHFDLRDRSPSSARRPSPRGSPRSAGSRPGPASSRRR